MKRGFEIEDIKQKLLSFLKEGKHSPFVNELFKLLVKFTISFIHRNVNPVNIERIMSIHGFSTTKDFAIDCLGGLFQEQDGLFININYFFLGDKVKYEGKKIKITEVPEELIYSKLRTIAWCNAKQYVYDINNPDYVNKRKSVKVSVDRNNEFVIEVYKDVQYVRNIFTEEVSFDLPQIPVDELLDRLLEENIQNHSTPSTMREVFDILKTQSDYCKAIELNLIVQCLVEYEKRRLKDYIESMPVKVSPTDSISFFDEFKLNFDKVIELKNPSYKKELYEGKYYIFTCLLSKVIFEKEHYPMGELYKKLTQSEWKKLNILQVMKVVFHIVNSQSEYCKALEYSLLLETLLKFYMTYL